MRSALLARTPLLAVTQRIKLLAVPEWHEHRSGVQAEL